MKARCKPGDIAVIVKELNIGKLVSILRLYKDNERVNGSRWEVSDGIAWVTESLGLPMPSVYVDGLPSGSGMVQVIYDHRLRPLRKGNGQDEMLRLTGKPKDKPVVAKKRGRPAKQKEVSHG